VESFLTRAVEIASLMPIVRGKQRLGAVAIDSRGHIISSATNNYNKTHPLQRYFSELAGFSEDKCYLHAELATLLKARTKQVDILYVARIMKNNHTGLAKPCNACMEAIKAYEVRKVVYTISDNEFGTIEF